MFRRNLFSKLIIIGQAQTSHRFLTKQEKNRSFFFEIVFVRTSK